MQIVRKILFVILLSGIVIPKEFLHLIIHIPSLVRHYQHHGEYEADLFNTIHPAGPGEGQVNSPFDHEHCVEFSQNLLFIAVLTRTDNMNFPEEVSLNRTNNDSEFNCREFNSAVWQPPKTRLML